MSVWRHLRHGFGSLFDRDETDRDIADEVRQYIDEATAELMASGLPADEARRRARLELGNEAVVREEVRSYGWENTVERLVEDLRYAARRLRNRPGFAALSVLTLALGIGATTAMFSAARPVLFEPLPYPDPDDILTIHDRASDGSPIEVTFGTYREVAERSRSFEALAVMRPWQPTLRGAAQPERLAGQRVSASYFRVLGISPVLGRPFDPADDRVGGPKRVILAHALWRGRFGADSAIVGRRITLDDDPYTVIGVMGEDFENVLAPSARVWSLLQYDAALPSFDGREWGHHLRMIGRLRPAVSPVRAGRELERIAGAPIAEFSRPAWAALVNGFAVAPLKEEVTRAARPALLAVLGAVVLVLVIACVNVTNLLLGRGVQRRGEFAMRAALGASRPRLLQQLLTESLMLATLGGMAGLVLAAFGVRTLIALSPPELPRLSAIRMDGEVFAVALAVTTVVGALVGLMPALQASRSDPQRELGQGSRHSTDGHRLARNALVIGEVSLTLVLLIGTGLLLRSLDRLFAIDPGFEAAGLLTLQVQASGRRFDDEGATHRFFAGALDAVRSVPGVSAAALTSQLPLSGESDAYGIRVESGASAGPGEEGGALRYAVSPSYLETLGIPLRRGRRLDERDAAGAPVAVLISESLARRRFPAQDPIGRRIHVGRTDLPWYTIVGVVGDVKQVSLAASESEAVYITPEQWYFADPAMWLVVRARGDAAALVPALEEAIWSVDPDQPIVRVATMEDLVAASAAERLFAMKIFRAFALAALVLAGIGLYGVLSGAVAERMRELGVRSALGATRGSLLGLVVRQGMTLTALGVLLGLGGAVAMSQALVTLLFGISPLDPTTYLGVITLLALIAATACAVPAWRAARVDPASVLRTE